MDSPDVGVPPGAVDYFYSVNAERRSWRAVRNLGLVITGRCVISLGLGGLSQSFVPGPLSSPHPPAGPNGPQPLGTVHHHWLLQLGIVGTVIGLLVHLSGVYCFHADTRKINTKRAHLAAAAGIAGVLLVAGGGVQASLGAVELDSRQQWEALPVRSLGNFLVFGALPNSFASSEIVHGLTPLKHRLIVRDVCFAAGGGFLMAWAMLSTPSPPAPLWAREMTQCLGIFGVAAGGALPRSEAQRAQADARIALRRVADISPA